MYKKLLKEEYQTWSTEELIKELVFVDHDVTIVNSVKYFSSYEEYTP